MRSPAHTTHAVLWVGLLLLFAPGCASRQCAGTPGVPAVADTSLHDALLSWVELNAAEPKLSVLALSGGAANGAFGAGVLNGWREAGRPDFHAITGVSAGALISTFAFLNTPEADASLERIVVGLKRSDLFCMRTKLLIPFSSSAATSDGLRNLLEREITPEILRAVARRSEEGKRLLLVSTTNLDRGTRHLWDMGALARRGDIRTYRLVLLAASSIPGAVPPVYINSVMHMDASVVEQVFVPSPRDMLPSTIVDELADAERKRTLIAPDQLDVYVVINGLLREKPECVQPRIFDILARSLNTALVVKKTDNLWRIFATTTEHGGDFHLIYVPDSHFDDAYDSIAFNTDAMHRLFEVGRKMGAEGSHWLSRPPEIGTDGILTQRREAPLSKWSASNGPAGREPSPRAEPTQQAVPQPEPAPRSGAPEPPRTTTRSGATSALPPPIVRPR